MTGPEHILAWIESSAPEYAHLCRIANSRSTSMTFRALECFTLAKAALRAMIQSGDAFPHEHSAATILGAAMLIDAWEVPA